MIDYLILRLETYPQDAGTRPFILTEKTRTRAQAQPTLYDQFSPEDRALFLFAKRAVPPAEMKELQQEAAEEGKDLDVVVLFRVFGAERIRKYEQLLEKREHGF